MQSASTKSKNGSAQFGHVHWHHHLWHSKIAWIIETVNIISENFDYFNKIVMNIRDFSLHTLNISWTSLDGETIQEIPNYINEHLNRLNIAGCRKTMSDEGNKRFLKPFS